MTSRGEVVGFVGGWGRVSTRRRLPSVRCAVAMKVGGGRSTPARSKAPNARVRSSAGRKSNSGSSTSSGRGKASVGGAGGVLSAGDEIRGGAAEEDGDGEDDEDDGGGGGEAPPSRVHVNEILEECAKLIFFRHVLEDDAVRSLLTILEVVDLSSGDEPDEDAAAVAEAYRDYFCALAERGQSWPDRFLSLLLHSDHVLSAAAQKKKPDEELPQALLTAAARDLRALQKLFRFDPETVANLVASLGGENSATAPSKTTTSTPTTTTTTTTTMSTLPLWTLSDAERDEFLSTLAPAERDIRARLEGGGEPWEELVVLLDSHYRARGAGTFAHQVSFLWDADVSELHAVHGADDVTVEDILGCRWQKKQIRQNVEFLLAGLPSQNMLLTGPRGCGKSSLVKAFVNTNAARGLRLVEVDSVLDMESFRALFEKLRDRVQKFVVFVDDFNYDADEEEYRCLRKLLDGSVMRIPRNVILCVTSCRYLAEAHRGGPSSSPSGTSSLSSSSAFSSSFGADDADLDEVFFEEDVFGFSDRFGTMVSFDEASNQKYIDTVKHLAARAGIGDIDSDILELRAAQFGRSRGGFCGRTARHFVDFLTSEQSFLKTEMTGNKSIFERINEVTANLASSSSSNNHDDADDSSASTTTSAPPSPLPPISSSSLSSSSSSTTITTSATTHGPPLPTASTSVPLPPPSPTASAANSSTSATPSARTAASSSTGPAVTPPPAEEDSSPTNSANNTTTRKKNSPGNKLEQETNEDTCT